MESPGHNSLNGGIEFSCVRKTAGHLGPAVSEASPCKGLACVIAQVLARDVIKEARLRDERTNMIKFHVSCAAMYFSFTTLMTVGYGVLRVTAHQRKRRNLGEPWNLPAH